MDTLKTAVVVVLLLAVLYGVYVVLNKPQEPLPEDIAYHQNRAMEPLEVEFGAAGGMPQGIAAADSPPVGLPHASAQLTADAHSHPHSAAPGEVAAPLLIDSSAADAPAPPLPAGPPEAAANSAPPSAWPQDPPAMATAAGADADAAPADAPGSPHSPVASALQSAQDKINQGQWYDALLTLSFAFNSPGLSQEETQQLLGWLDPLAAKVIYSKEHHMGPPYEVKAGETLAQIAKNHEVPWQLLANINGIKNEQALPAGTQLKIVPGPFHADVDLTNQVMTLFIGRLYAGRFPIAVNADNVPPPREYEVQDKQPGSTFYAGDARTVAADDPQNPFGGIWIDLGSGVCLHARPDTPAPGGCISLSRSDANDLYGILSRGSSVVIRR